MDELQRKLEREAKADPSLLMKLKQSFLRSGAKPELLTVEEASKKVLELTKNDGHAPTRVGSGTGWGSDYGEEPDVKFSRIENGFEVKLDRMYDEISISFAILKKLSDFFGTVKIDLDDWARGGCETCDHGSSYGVSIQIYESTKNNEFINSL
jgi:hypothetical protein